MTFCRLTIDLVIMLSVVACATSQSSTRNVEHEVNSSKTTSAQTQSDDSSRSTRDSDETREKTITAAFKASEGGDFDGNVELTETEAGVKVVIDIVRGPPGEKGAHIHQKADCSDIKNKSMGGHFDPNDNPHGLPGALQTHVGDMGNLTIGPGGEGHLVFEIRNANLTPGDRMSLRNRAVVIHTGPDKGTQPSGDAGPPMACAPLGNS